ncbi:hypothetical protein [Massilia putida]|nr:hypothetical protein [Massilia putida]
MHKIAVLPAGLLMFLHYWCQGKAQDQAKAVRAAIDLTGTAPAKTAPHG